MWLYRRYFNKKITCRWIQSSMFRFTDLWDSSVKSLSNNKDFELIKGDIRDKEKLQEAIKGSDAIVHLAAIVGDKPCDAAINASYDINFNGTKILAEIAEKQKIGKFIFASTCSNYGISNPNEFAKETSSLNPVSLYAEKAKLTAKNFEKFL